MKHGHNHIDLIKIEAFFDRELEPEARARLREHTEQCPICTKMLEENKTIAATFGALIIDETRRAESVPLDDVIWDAVGRHGTTRSFLGFLGTHRRTWVPAIAAAATLVFFIALFSPAPSHSEPSAYVQSLRGDTVSVMILETPQTRQTVLWFKEAQQTPSDLGEEQDYEGWLFFKHQQLV